MVVKSLPKALPRVRSSQAYLQSMLHRRSSFPGLDGLARAFSSFTLRRRKKALQGKSGIPTIVVGSQTFGGAGKTPICLELAMRMRIRCATGLLVRPTLRGGWCGIVSDDADAHKVGDEATMFRSVLPGDVMLFSHQDLVQGQRLAEQHVECLIVDDGLRCPGLSCDLSILVVDHGASSDVFPIGPCREGDEGMELVDLVWVNKVDEAGGRNKPLARVNVKSSYVPECLVNGSGETMPLSDIANRPVTLACGIGRPESFYHTVSPWITDLVRVLEYGDHERYRFPELSVENEIVITTEKDLARNPPSPGVWALRIRLSVLDEAYLNEALDNLFGICSR